jgi:hypothetical protein
MLSQYDEYPIHQAARPFAHIPSTDYSWDDGYYFGAFSADEGVFLLTGMRVNPNADMIGGYAIINVAGRQYSVRVSRCWRRQMDTRIGPLAYRFVEPLRVIRLTLEPNDSALSFDLTWSGVAPAFEEDHHYAETRGRATTDKTRYSQPGAVSGFIQFQGKRYEVTPDRWAGDRDHSWGLYADRKPLGGYTEWLPPRPVPAVRRALRFWTLFTADQWSGFYHLHESESGEQVRMNDVFGSPFEGMLFPGWEGRPVKLASARHELVFERGTRILKSAVLHLQDEQGRAWQQRFEVAAPPWVPQTMGYTPGSWKDGGTMHTYHGSEELALEWDDFDFSRQPFEYTAYPPRHGGARVSNEEISKAFGLGTPAQCYGVEYLARIELISPQGTLHRGQGHVECFVDGRFDPYGFE